MIPRDLTFLFPKAGLLLLAIPLFLALFFYAKKRKQNALEHLASPKMLPQIASFLSHPWLRLLSFLLFWIFAVLAFMNPVGNEHFKSESVKISTQDIIFLLDSSASMAVTDTPTKISRFDYAKEIADLIIKQLKGNDMMLATFTTGTTLVVPQTHDALFLRIRLKDLEINEGGNAPGTDYLHSLEELKKMIFDPKTTPETLVIFSDGGDTSLEGLTGKERETRIANILQAVSSKHFPNLKIYTVGMGSLAGGTIPERPQAVMKLDRSLLEGLSKMTNGKFYIANDYNAEDLAKSIVEQIEKQNANLESSKQLLTTRIYDEYFQIPLLISIGFLLLFMLFPAIKRPILGLIVFTFFQTLVATEDFVARQRYDAGEYADAANDYNNLLMTMPVAYQPLIHYNLGTILLAEKKPLQAIDVLEIIPFANELSSNVKRRALINIAVAYNVLQEQSVDPFVKVFYLRKALQALHDADTLDCSEQHCVPSADFDVIKMELTQEMKALQSELEGIDRFAILWDEGGNRSFPRSVKLEDLKDALFLEYENLPNKTLLEDIQRLYTLDQDKSLILALQTKAAELQSSNRNLQRSRELEAKGEEALSKYFFWNAFRDFQKSMINRMTNLAKKGLINLIEDAKMTVRKELLLLQNPGKLAQQKSEIKVAAEQVAKLSRELPIAIYQWQQQRYKEGICQCTPWNEVFPLLRKGNELWNTNDAQYSVLASQKLAIQQWQRALEVMQTVPEGPGETSKNESETLNELQKMQLLDKEPAKPQKMPQGGKFW